ncbi:transcriptional regulator with XRE-family HTH domain [Pullulanibacillus pueri]|uniref:HTH cro/C1-type domain-containing protein n=1 Tax=Pullulanibacillus pueri TaxID=1437324 RepID=A0A8J3EMD4_9BACL|nr:helix-turn-helix transcriptional regulator [Pullulanibacillus pueri]MBM7682059.1 transcriptional regulator with XRE-family HTH domain [Pullulanibacillus pueri]GGH80137.1 hypothetical protein GCM10007096_16100 [Pullulanibacillus pueri]
MNELGELLKALRGERSLRAVAESTGLSHSYIADIEKGYRRATHKPLNPSPETLKKLAKAYNYSYEQLMEKAGYLENQYDYTVQTQSPLSGEIKEHLMNDPETESFFKGYLNAPEDKKKQMRDFMRFLLNNENKE